MKTTITDYEHGRSCWATDRVTTAVCLTKPVSEKDIKSLRDSMKDQSVYLTNDPRMIKAIELCNSR